MTMYEPNPVVQPTGEEAGEFVEAPEPVRPDDETDSSAEMRGTRVDDEQLIAAVAQSRAGAAATVVDVEAFIRASIDDKFDPDGLVGALQRLALAGRLDRVDAAPGSNGLPEYAFAL